MSRRSMMAGAGYLAGAALTPGNAAPGQRAAPGGPAPADSHPPDVGRKFFADGSVMPFAGNTIICHLPQQGSGSAAFAALMDIYRALPRQAFAHKMTALPPSSYHMTVIGGANDKDRRRPQWPRDVSLDAPMAQCNAVVAARLKRFRLGRDAGPYRMKVDMADPMANETPLTLRLLPADHDMQVRLYRLRSRLADQMGIGIAQPDNYRFHITLGYTIAWLNADENAAFRTALQQWKEQVVACVPILELGAPEFCLLDDMFHFARQYYLT